MIIHGYCNALINYPLRRIVTILIMSAVGKSYSTHSNFIIITVHSKIECSDPYIEMFLVVFFSVQEVQTGVQRDWSD